MHNGGLALRGSPPARAGRRRATMRAAALLLACLLAGSTTGGGTLRPPPAAGGECGASCVPGKPGCPLRVPGAKCDTLVSLVRGNLADLLANGTAAHDGHAGAGSRCVPSGALSTLLLGCPQGPGCCAPSNVACVQPPAPPACAAALRLLRTFGDAPGTSFGGQAYPMIWHTYSETCFGAIDRAWLLQNFNRSLPMTIAEATPQVIAPNFLNFEYKMRTK